MLKWREETIAKKHDRKKFVCGHETLNRFLALYARQAHDSGASRTFVAVDPSDGTTVLGYYSLTPTELDFEQVPPAARPSGGRRHAVGGVRLARLAVGRSFHGQGLGGALLLSAARRCIRASSEIGGSLILIDAKDEEAANWYRRFGAIGIPQMPLTLVLPYAIAVEAMQEAGQPI